MSSEAHINQLCEQFLNNQIPYAQFIRSFVSHQAWIIPTTQINDEQHVAIWRGGNSEQYLAVFSTKEQLADYLKSSGMTEDQPYIIARGSWIFAHVPENLTALVVNPQSSSALQFTPNKFNISTNELSIVECQNI